MSRSGDYYLSELENCHNKIAELERLLKEKEEYIGYLGIIIIALTAKNATKL